MARVKSGGELRRPTMTDVAKLAGVSQSTVSMVLNGMPGARLSPETRERVLKCAVELGYRLPRRPIDLPGRGLSRPVIGYLVDEISTSPHPVGSVDGARDAAWEQGVVLQVVVTRNNPDQERAAVESLQANPQFLGCIVSTIFTRKVHVSAWLAQIPIVLLNCHADDFPGTCVVPAELSGGHTATERLIQAGHRRIGFINGEPWMEAAVDRFRGYRRALASADLTFDPELVRAGDWMVGSGYEHTLSLMRRANPPTALFCANDLMAVGALEALTQLGLRVPDDVALIGYDDQEISRHTRPPLTTLVLPNYEMGRVAAEMLIAEAKAAAGAAQSRRRLIKIECPLVERDSVQRRSDG